MKHYFAALAVLTLLAPVAATAATVKASDLTIGSAIKVDTANHTATLPIHRGTADGKTIWYIVTDASDVAVAKKYRVNYSPSIANLGDAAIADVTRNGDTFVYPGAPDFSPTRTYVASEGGFPPKSATPGSTAPDSYSPFIRVAGINGVLNAPVIATGDSNFDVTTHTNTEDRVIAIDTVKGTATLTLARGFFNNKPIYYLSTEASDPVAAAVERATFVPRLGKASQAGEIPIGVVVNGPQTGSAPQGLAYLALKTALGDDATAANLSKIGSPFNVLSLAPTLGKLYANNGYSPLWNVAVVGEKQAKRLTTYAKVAPLTKQAGFVVNCPVVAYGDESSY